MIETLLVIALVIIGFIFVILPIALFLFILWFEWSERHLPRKKK